MWSPTEAAKQLIQAELVASGLGSRTSSLVLWNVTPY